MFIAFIMETKLNAFPGIKLYNLAVLPDITSHYFLLYNRFKDILECIPPLTNHYPKQERI